MRYSLNSSRGVTLVETVMAVALLAVGALSLGLLSTNVNSGITNSRAQFGAQSLHSALATTISDPVVCSQRITKNPFSAALADITAGSPGYPLKFTLQDGNANIGTTTVVDGSIPAYNVPNFSVQINGLTFQINGTVPIAGLVDPNPGSGCSTTNNSVYAGDVILTVKKETPSSDVAGGSSLSNEFVGTLMLTVDNNTKKVCRCYAPDPCTAIGGTYNPNNIPSCNLCPTNQTWVGNNTSTGAPICLPNCSLPVQFLVSNGAGGAVCKAPQCPAGALSWSVGANTCMGNVLATGPSTVSAPIVSTNGHTGGATFTCSPSGTWPALPDAGATCSAIPSNCPAQAVTWTVGAATCAGAVLSTPPSTTTVPPVSSTNGNTGSASFTCSATGTWGPANAGATCTVPPGQCPVQTLTWTVGTNTCSGPAPLPPESTVSSTINSTNGTTGAATFNCPASGVWPALPNAGATCSNCTTPVTFSWREPGNGNCTYASDATWVTAYTSLLALNPPAADLAAFNAAISANGPNFLIGIGPAWPQPPAVNNFGFLSEHGSSGTLTWSIRGIHCIHTDNEPPMWAGSVTYCQ